MSSNLPPGMSESDIPGNRPEDTLYEKLFNRLPISIQNEIEKETQLGEKLNEQFHQLIDQIFTEEDVLQEMQIIESYLINEDNEENIS